MKVFPQEPVHAAPGCVYQHIGFLFCTESTGAWAAPRLIYTLRRPLLHPACLKHWSWATPWRICTTEVFAAPGIDYALGLNPELHLHCEKSWRKTPPAWPDVTNSLVRGTENFFYMKIELNRRVPTMKTEYFEISEIFLRLIWRVLTIMTEYFEISGIFRQFLISREGVFRQFSVSFPTINQNQRQQHQGSIFRPSGSQSTTLPLRHTHFVH